MGAEYLNIDLEIRAQFDLTPLREAFGEHVAIMYCGECAPGQYLLALESEYLGDNTETSPDLTANTLCQLVENLTPSARKAWDEADDRIFDVGYDAVADPRCSQPLLSARTLQRISALNARLAISVYTHGFQSAAEQSLS